MINGKKLAAALPHSNAIWIEAMVEQMPKFGIEGLAVEAAFLGQVHHECVGFTVFEENLNYRDPERIAKIFRRAFDIDHDGVIEPHEIDAAKAYVRNPQKLANRVYANKYGNGDEMSGDGWKYRGRGPIQTTFKANYVKASFWTGVNLVLTPDELLVPRTGCAAACGYFRDAGCIPLAQLGDYREITRRINPGMAGLEDRIRLVGDYQRILSTL